jgi:hypothetical protein
MKIAVVLPTRGLIFTEVMVALLRELKGYEYSIFMSWDRVIPDSHNELTKEALLADYILFLEEDVVMPEGSLEKMIGKGDIVALDYGVQGYSCITTFQGENMWCGLGCTLVKREVFEKLEYPYFRSDKALLLNDWPEIKWIEAGEQAYGGHDIYFGIKAREKGFKIIKAEGEARHLKLESLGRPEINKGLHQIIDKPKISKHTNL